MNNSKKIFDQKISNLLKGKNSDETIEKFSKTSNKYFYTLEVMKSLKERQIASIIGFKDEFFVETIINQIIIENKLTNKFYCKKVTANNTSGIKIRSINKLKDKNTVTIGGDCVIFDKNTEKPILIIECKEYIDMIRMKELIGESRIIKDEITKSKLLNNKIKFWVFAEVLELTDNWAYLFNDSDLKYKIDKVFIVRKGKRKDIENKPKKEILIDFRDKIKDFLISYIK